MSKGTIYCLVLSVVIAVLFVLNILVGSVHIPVADTLRILMGEQLKPSWQYIILESRLPQALTATLAGGALAVSGLMLQTAFRNPLAGPSVFGINSGAGLGVALVMLLLGGSISAGSVSLSGFVAVLVAAFLGAMGVMAVIFFFSNMVWGMGSFGGVSMKMMPTFATVTLLGLLGSVLLIKPLNALMLGDRYAENLGINIVRVRNWLLIVTGLLTAIVTAFCGPVAFIGLAVPHIARLMLHTDNHRSLLPATILTGSIVALLCSLFTVLPGESGVIPLNAVTPLIGAPVIIYVIIKGRRQ